MNANVPPLRDDSTSSTADVAIRFKTAPIAAGLLCWVAISLGFLGLLLLMHDRPQFVGQPLTVSKTVLVQQSPQVVARKLSDDISVIKSMQPELSEVRFDMSGRRDYRGLRTIMDMSGECRARYVLTNVFEEPIFVLFKGPHPRGKDTGDTILAGGLKLQASTPGVQENVRNAWVWSGAIEAHGSTTIEISYQAASLKGIQYHVTEANGNPVRQHRVTFHRRDLDSMRFASGDERKQTSEDTVVWERSDFLAPDFFSADIVEGRNLYASLSHLLEMGPIICLLFLLAVSAVILGRQRLTAIQMVTIAAGYGLYFPLILYLSSRFSFVVALIIAVVVPAALLLNYARWLFGARVGLIGGMVFLALYQVFPTLAAFAGWNRGMVLLCLGVVTLWVLINLQNQALKRKAVSAGALVALLLLPSEVKAGEVQVVLTGELAKRLAEPARDATNALVAFDPASYQIRHDETYFAVEARVPFQVIRTGDAPVPLFAAAVHLQETHFDAAGAELARLVTISNRPGLFTQRSGSGALRLLYRVPIEHREGKQRATIPLVLGPSGSVRLESARHDFEVLAGGLWAKRSEDKMTVYEIGVAGEEFLAVEWREQAGGSPQRVEGGREFYGIGLTRAQHLTVINSDGSCTHFAEFELPALQTDELRIRLPPNARLISVSVNGAEVNAPVMERQLCRIRLPAREPQQTAHRVSFRMAYPPVRLGFVGTAELELPELFQTAGTVEWTVALPGGFDTQVIASGLETQKTPADLDRFGDYGRIVKAQPHTSLARSLAPPGIVNLSLKYRQAVPGFFEDQER